MVPTKFGIAFTALFLNQAGALVHVYSDGSVLLSHGGTEMGQGLHTKMIQCAARALGIDSKYIHIAETATDKVSIIPFVLYWIEAQLPMDCRHNISLSRCQTRAQRQLHQDRT